jgi:hypothetical protein
MAASGEQPGGYYGKDWQSEAAQEIKGALFALFLVCCR